MSFNNNKIKLKFGILIVCILILTVSFNCIVAKSNIQQLSSEEYEEKQQETNNCNDNWTFFGLKGKYVTSLAATENYLYAGVDDYGVFRKNLQDQDSKWEYMGFFTKKVKSIYIDPNHPETIYIGLEKGGRIKLLFNRWNSHSLYKSTNGGRKWIPCDKGIENRELIFRYRLPIKCITALPGNPNTVYATSICSVFKSTNGGKNWELAWGNKNGFGVGTHAIAIAPSDSNQIWAGGESALLHPFIVKSTDDGVTWNDTFPPASGDNAVYSIAIHPHDSNIVYVGMEGHAVKTVNGGKNWTIILSPSNGPYFRALAIDSSNPDHIFVGDGPCPGYHRDPFSQKIWESHDGGKTWKSYEIKVEDGGKAVICLSLDTRVEHDTIYVGTIGGGIWKLDY